ncbi:hypothetical protein AOLI_G00103160 [Acnodon oligacanthus]
MKSVVTTGVTVTAQRRQPGKNGLETQSESTERRMPNKATMNSMERYPQGCPRGGKDEHPSLTDTMATDSGAAQRTGVQPGETQLEPGPESSHSPRNLHVLLTNPPSIKLDQR